MKKDLRKYQIILLLISLFIVQLNYSQSQDNPWIIGIGANAIDLYPTNAPGNGNDNGIFNEYFNVEDHWNIGGPQIMVTRYLSRNFSIDGLLTFNQITKYGDVPIDKTTYFGVDVNLRYSFIDTYKDFTIFALAGFGYTSFNPIIPSNYPLGSSGTFNIGGGVNYWFSETVGLNFESLYKHGFSNLPSHFYYGLSLVFRASSGKKMGWRNGR